MLRNLVLSYQNNYQNYLLCVCTVWGGGDVCLGGCVEISGQLCGAGSLILSVWVPGTKLRP